MAISGTRLRILEFRVQSLGYRVYGLGLMNVDQLPYGSLKHIRDLDLRRRIIFIIVAAVVAV